MEKSPEAFRTISEVADWLGVPTHVLRFWESRFTQIKPVKRAGGRRYYRPADMLLIGGIKRLLHDDGMTIRGVQKMLREEGVKHVASYSQPIDADGPTIEVSFDEVEDVEAVEKIHAIDEAAADEDFRTVERIAAGDDAEPAGMTTETEPEEVPPSPMAVDVEPEPLDNVLQLSADADDDEAAGGAAKAQEDAAQTELAFLKPKPSAEPPKTPAPARSAAPHARPAEPRETTPDLFTSRRSAPPPDAPPAAAPPSPPEPASEAKAAPRIPPTPGIPATDPTDDEPSIVARPGLAARLRARGARAGDLDPAILAKAVADLRALRDRPRV